MKLKVVVDDGLIIVDAKRVKLDFSSLSGLPNISNLWAISWNDALAIPGEMELRNGTANVPFADITSVQFFIDAHAAEVARIEAEALATATAIANDIDLNKANKLAEMDAAASDAILAGFTSNALGFDHKYGGKKTDQLNLIGAASAGVDMVFPCADSGDIWARRMHTAAQLKAVVADGAEYKQAVLTELDARRAEIDGASDLTVINSVIWSEV